MKTTLSINLLVSIETKHGTDEEIQDWIEKLVKLIDDTTIHNVLTTTDVVGDKTFTLQSK